MKQADAQTAKSNATKETTNPMRTSREAITAITLSATGLVLALSPLFILSRLRHLTGEFVVGTLGCSLAVTAIVAAVAARLGFRARRQIRASGGRLGGRWLAAAAIATCSLGPVLDVGLLYAVFDADRQHHHPSGSEIAIRRLKTYATAQSMYRLKFGRFADSLLALHEERYIDKVIADAECKSKAATESSTRYGYCFALLRGEHGEAVNMESRCPPIGAFPGLSDGTAAFILDEAVIYRKDSRDTPVHELPANFEDEGWSAIAERRGWEWFAVDGAGRKDQPAGNEDR